MESSRFIADAQRINQMWDAAAQAAPAGVDPSVFMLATQRPRRLVNAAQDAQTAFFVAGSEAEARGSAVWVHQQGLLRNPDSRRHQEGLAETSADLHASLGQVDILKLAATRSFGITEARQRLGRGAVLAVAGVSFALGAGGAEAGLQALQSVGADVVDDRSIAPGNHDDLIPGFADVSSSTYTVTYNEYGEAIVKTTIIESARDDAQNDYASTFDLTGKETTQDKVITDGLLRIIRDHNGTIKSAKIIGKGSDEAKGKGSDLGVANPQIKALGEKRAQAGKNALLLSAQEQGVAIDETSIIPLGEEVLLSATDIKSIDDAAASRNLSREELVDGHNNGQTNPLLTKLLDKNRGVEYELVVSQPHEETAIKQTAHMTKKYMPGIWGEIVAGASGIGTALFWGTMLSKTVTGRMARRRARSIVKQAQAADQVQE